MIALDLGICAAAARCLATAAVPSPAPTPGIAWRNVIASYGPGNDGAWLSAARGSTATLTNGDSYANDSAWPLRRCATS